MIKKGRNKKRYTNQSEENQQNDRQKSVTVINNSEYIFILLSVQLKDMDWLNELRSNIRQCSVKHLPALYEYKG